MWARERLDSSGGGKIAIKISFAMQADRLTWT